MLKIRAEALAGDSTQETAAAMVALASKLGVAVEVPFNGVDLIAFPGGDPQKLAVAYLKALRAERADAVAYSDGQWMASGAPTAVQGAT